MIRGKFLAQDDFDLAGHRFRNWQWIADIPTREGEEGQTIAIVDGEARWVIASADGIVVVEWADILNKPIEFTPEEHTHPWDEVTGKPTFVNTLTANDGITTNATTGNVIIGLTENVQQALDFFVGAVLGQPTVDVTSDGADIILTLTGSPDTLVLLFNRDGSGPVDFDTLTADPVTLTAGTDDEPVMNFIWIPSDTLVLTTGAAWPTDIDYVPLATVYCQSAASAQTYGLYKVHAWTDHTHTPERQGHLGHLNAWIRTQPATWREGTAVSPSLGADEFDIALTGGVVLQLHEHDFPAMTSVAGSEPIYVYNDFTTAFKRVANMSAELTDSDNDSLSNRYYSIVLWGVISEDADDCKMMVNLPSGSYNGALAAQADSSGYADFGIPTEFAGTGFLIARLVVRHQVAGNTFTLVESIDLRGTFPGGFTGGSAGSGDHGALIGLSDMDHPTSALQQTSATTNQVLEWTGSTWLPTSNIIVASISLSGGISVGSHMIIDGNIDIAGDIGFSVGGQITGVTTFSAQTIAVAGTATFSGDVAGISHTDVGAAATTHTHDIDELEQSGASTNDGILWNGSTWLANPVVRIAASAFATDFINGTPSTSHIILMESTGGSQRRCAMAVFPISTPVQNALNTKSDTDHTHVHTRDPMTIYVETPTSTDSFPVACVAITETVSQITCEVDSGTVTFNIEERAAAMTAGTDVHSGAISATATSNITNTFVNAEIAAGAWLHFDCDSVAGSPAMLQIKIEFEEQ